MLCCIDGYTDQNAFNALIGDQVCFDKESSDIKDITRAISDIDQDTATLDQFVIDKMGFYSNYGQISLLESQVTEFLKTLSLNGSNNQSAVHIASLIYNISKNILNATGYDEGLINVRGFTAGLNDGYFPNWHVDKSVEEVIDIEHQLTKNHCDHMFIFLLKGNTTLFHSTSQTLREKFYLMANESAYTYGYDYNLQYIKGEGLDKILSINNTYRPDFGQGSVHLTGKECGTIHAVPESRERLFISIFPSTKENISLFKDVVYRNLY